MRISSPAPYLSFQLHQRFRSSTPKSNSETPNDEIQTASSSGFRLFIISSTIIAGVLCRFSVSVSRRRCEIWQLRQASTSYRRAYVSSTENRPVGPMSRAPSDCICTKFRQNELSRFEYEMDGCITLIFLSVSEHGSRRNQTPYRP